MGFAALLGNSRLKENLAQSFLKNRTSHFYLISGPSGSGKRTLARLLAAALLCERADKPCGSCEACRKVFAGSHPDVITVTDAQHKTVAVKLVRQAREDLYIKPHEGKKKIYIFPQELGLEGQNALLKSLEEPPAYGVFLLLTENPEQLLPTIRSRATQLSLLPLSQAVLEEALGKEFPQADKTLVQGAVFRSGGYLGKAREIVMQEREDDPRTQMFGKAFAKKQALALLEVLVPMEKWKRDQALPELMKWRQLLHGALLCRSGLPAQTPLMEEISLACSSQRLYDGISALQKAMDYLQSNVSVAAVCGYLGWALR